MEATLWPYGKCEKCANKNYCAWSESEILNCMNNDYPNFSQMRNADQIRAMTDEELVEIFANNDCGYCRIHDFCFAKGSAINCEDVWLDWLKQEAT